MSASATSPKLVADFEYDGFEWWVLDWAGEGNEAHRFEVYRADLPCGLKHDCEDVRS